MDAYQVVHLILPCVGFWIALTIVISILLHRHRRRWPISMIFAAALVALVVVVVTAKFGVSNLP